MMKITGLEKQKKNKNRYNLYVDELFFEGVEENTIAILNLYVGKELSEEDARRIRTVELEEKLHGRALALLGRYRKTEWEMRRYILARGYSGTMASRELDRLKEYSFIDDAAYVRDFLEFNAKDSIRMVRYKLKAKGVADALVESVISGYDVRGREETALRDAAVKKFKMLKGKDNLRDRLYRYLMGKGFDSEMITDIIGELESKE